MTQGITEPMKGCNSEKKYHGVLSSAGLILLTTAVIFGIYYFLLWAYNVFPFSQKAPSQYDLLAQIVPFAEHFFDVKEGNASIFYSLRVGAGMDVFGTVAYCLISPFSFIFWLFGEGNVWYAASLMIPVKLSCIAASAIVMIKLNFKEMRSAVALLVALLYAFCGYTFVANTYINWMDYLIWMPMFVPAFRYLREKGRILPMTLLIAACIYTCFSIACFSMLVSYPILILYAAMVVEKGEKREYITKLSLCYLCGILLALPLMLPALMAYLGSGRNTGFFDALWNDFSALSYYRKFSYILSDAFFLICIFVYFLKTHFATKESRFLAVAGLIVMMPVLVDECCILMNMGSYMSYALRFGFLNALFELYVSCLVLQSVRLDGKTVFEKNDRRKEGLLAATLSPLERKDKKRKKIILPQVLIACGLTLFVATAILGVYEVFTVTRGESFIDFSLFPRLSEWIESAEKGSVHFASSFAHSTGGLEGVAIICCIIAAVSVLFVFLYETKILSAKAIYPFVAVTVLANVLFYGSTLVAGNTFNPVRYREYDSLLQSVLTDEELQDYEYRIKDYNAYLSDNQGLITKTNAYSVFSSLTDDTNFAFQRVFGMGGNGVNTLKSRNGTLLGDCLIGNKYVFFNSEGEGEKGAELNREYLREVAREEHFILYENTLVFPSAFTLSAGEMGVEDDYDCYFDNMRNLYRFLGGEGDVFTTLSLQNSDVKKITVTDPDTEESVPAVQVKIYLKKSGDYTFDFGKLAEREELGYYTGSYSKDGLRPLSKIKTYTYHDATPNSYYSLYFIDPSDQLTEADVINSCSVKCIERETVERLSQSLSERQVKYGVRSTLWKTDFTASVHAAEKGEQLFLNYVALKGHTAYVNGKKVELQANGLNMLVVPLEEGENEVVIEYESPYVGYALFGVAASAIALGMIACLICGKRGRKVIEAVKTPVTVAAVVLVVLVVGLFMVFPTGVMFWKLLL